MDGMVGMDPRDLPDHQVHQDNQGHQVSKKLPFFSVLQEMTNFVPL